MTHISKEEAFEIYASTKMPQDASPDDVVYLLCNAAIEHDRAKREPLSEDVINRLWELSFVGADPTSGNQRFKFARGIEQAHGIGVKP